MMRRAVVHIGLPRTGTTSVQRVFSRLRPQLADIGILYPALTPHSASEPHLSHQHLGETLDGRRPSCERVELLDSLSRQLADSDADTVLISYEHLCLIPPRLGTAALLADLFARHGFAMEILATIKPQAEFLNSTYTWRTQFLREPRGFVAYAEAQLGSRQLDYAALFEPWRRASAGRITVLPLRPPRTQGTLLERFLDAADLEPARSLITEDDIALVDNRSPGPIAVEVCRRLRGGGAQRRLGRQARDATRFAEAACRDRGLDTAAFNGVDPALREAITMRWQAANDRLAAIAWSEPWANRVASAPSLPVTEIFRTADPIGLRETEAVLHAVCDRFGLPLGDRATARAWNMMSVGLPAAFGRLVQGLPFRVGG